MTVPVFLVSPDAGVAWRVSFEGTPETHAFIDKRLAINYAREWAEANRPCRVVVRGKNGQTENAWDYPPRYLLRRR